MSIVRLVAAITIRSINDGDNNIVSIKLELSGVIFLPHGHYNINNIQQAAIIINFIMQFSPTSSHFPLLGPDILQIFKFDLVLIYLNEMFW
jgi:hypothetical protein